MNDNKKKNSGRRSAIPGLVILAAVLMLNAVDDAEAAVAIVVLLVIIGAVAATVAAVRKTVSGRGAAAPARSGQTRMPQFEKTPAARRAQPVRRTEAEEAVHCAHSRGKEKYLEQLDGFLANGIIDKAEYKLLKERYSRLEIEDDYH